LLAVLNRLGIFQRPSIAYCLIIVIFKTHHFSVPSERLVDTRQVTFRGFAQW